MRKFHQIFWVLLPIALYGAFWSVWSFVLQNPVPTVGKFLWNSGLALKKIMPNLQNPQDQFIYFPEASRWWDVALAPLGAMVLVLLYYNRKFNDDSLAYEDINFSWSKLVRDILGPFLRPYYLWKEKQADYVYSKLEKYEGRIGSLTPLERSHWEYLSQKWISMTQNNLERSSREIDDMLYPRMEGLKTVMVYCLTIGIALGGFIGLLLGPMHGPFGFFGMKILLGAFSGPMMLISRRVEIAVMVHIACWVGLSYGLSIGVGMIPAIVWTAYMFVPTGLLMVLICFFRSRKKAQQTLALS